MDVVDEKITFLINSLSGGGYEGVCITIANGLAERGWRVSLVCVNLKKRDYLDRISDKVNLVNLNISRFALSFFPMLRYLKREKVRYIVCFHYFFASQLVMQRFLLRNQFKIIARNNTSLSHTEKYNFSSSFRKKLTFSLVKYLYPKVDYSIAQCHDMKLDLVQNYHFDSKRVKVIYNPVNDKIEKSYSESKYKKEGFILAVGRLSKEKRFDIAIKIFAKVNQQYPQLKLKFVGQGDQEEYLKEFASKCGVYQSVEFLGFQKDLGQFYKNAKLTLMTSSFEGFPNVLVESITLGTPVVSFDCPTGPREIIQDGINGFLVEKDNEKMLEEKIIKAINMKWSVQAIHDTADIYKNDAVIAECEKLFKSIVSPNEEIYQ